MAPRADHPGTFEADAPPLGPGAANRACVDRGWRSSFAVGALLVLLTGCLFGRGGSSGPQSRAADDNSMGAFEFGRGELSNAEAYFAAGLETSRSIDDAAGQAVALLNLSRVDAQRWRFDRALSRAQSAEALAGSDAGVRGAALAQLAALRARTGQHDAAIADAREALGLVERLEVRKRDAARLRGDRHTTLAFALVHAGGSQCVAAEQALAAATRAYGRRIDLAARAAIAQLRGMLALGRRDPTTASTHLDTALQLDLTGDRDQAATWLARALAVRESIDTPRRALATAERLSRLQSTPELEGRIALLRAEVGDHTPEPPVPPRPCE